MERPFLATTERSAPPIIGRAAGAKNDGLLELLPPAGEERRGSFDGYKWEQLIFPGINVILWDFKGILDFQIG